MKNYIAIAFIALAVTHYQENDRFVIKGRIGHFNAPAKVWLYYYNEKDVVNDTTAVSDGQFEFTGSTNGRPRVARLYLNRSGSSAPGSFNDYLEFYITGGTITVNSEDSLKHAVVKDEAIVNKEFDELEDDLDVLNNQSVYLLSQRNAILKNPGNDSTARMQVVFDAFKKLNKERRNIRIAFIKKHPGSWVSLDQLGMMERTNNEELQELESLLAILSPELKDSDQGKQFADIFYRQKLTALGKPAPDFTQKNTKGKSITLSSYRGKYVLIDFWASWCGPCRAENPNVLKAYKQFKDKNFMIIGVSLDTDKKKWLKAVADDGMPWIQVSDLKDFDNVVARLYGVRSIPDNFLVDPNGNIVAKNLRGDRLAQTLEQLIH